MPLESHQLRALRFYGGKSMLSSKGVGKWILSLLPAVESNQTYVEPFCGMASVLLARPPADNEVINDLDGRIATFWRVLRDEPDELERRLAATEEGREVFNTAQQSFLAGGIDDVSTAWALCVCLGQALTPSTAMVSKTWRIPNGIDRPKAAGHTWGRTKARLTSEAMRQRLADVSVENRDGVDVVSYFAANANAVIYCDPPYSFGSEEYAHLADLDALKEAVAGAAARVAISGYPQDTYDDLGDNWHRHEFGTTARGSANSARNEKTTRTECLWTNYPTERAVPQQLI